MHSPIVAPRGHFRLVIILLSLMALMGALIAAPAARASGTTVTFDDKTCGDPLTGQYPSCLIDWGTSTGVFLIDCVFSPLDTPNTLPPTNDTRPTLSLATAHAL